MPESPLLLLKNNLRGILNCFRGNVAFVEQLAEHPGQPDPSGSRAAVVMARGGRFSKSGLARG